MALPAALSLLLLLWVLCPTRLASQNPDSLRADTIPPPVYEIRGVTVTVPRPVSTTGGTSAVEVQLDSMVALPAPTLEQVLRRLPLIQIRRNSRGEAQPSLRGAEDRQIAVLMDGVPLTLGWDARTDLSVIPLTAAQRIDLVRGLASVLYGPNVLGGAVEVDIARGAERQARPRPFQADVGVDQTGASQVGVMAGTAVETGGGEWILRAGVGHQAREGFVLPGGAERAPGQDPSLLTRDGDLRLNTDEHRWDGFVSARYRSVGGSWLALSASGLTTERGVAPEAHVNEPRLWRYPEQRRLITAVSAGTGMTRTPLGEGDLEASLGMDLGHFRIDRYRTADYADKTGAEVGDDLTLTLRFLGDHTLGERGELRAALTYADVNHDETFPGEGTNRYRQRLWSLGQEVEWVFGSLLRLPGLGTTRLTLGAALDGADTPRSADKPPLGRLWDWGARAGLTTLARDFPLLLHASLSRRTRFPSLRELYSGALGRFVPNPDLRPEVLVGGEIGATLQGGWGELQVVGFRQRLSDGIIRKSLSTPEGKKYQRVNQSEILGRGVEILARSQLGLVGLSGDLTLQRVRGRDESGNEVRLEYEPSVAGKLGVGLPLPWRVESQAEFRYVGTQYCENPELGGLQSFGSSRALDLRLSRAFETRVARLSRALAMVSLDNVTDAVIFGQCGLPEPGRTLRLQLRIW